MIKLGPLNQHLALKFVMGEIAIADMMPDGAFTKRGVGAESLDIKELIHKGNAGGYV